MSNILTVIISLFIYFIAHSFSAVLDMAIRSKIVVFEYFVRGMQLLFPPLEALNTKDAIGSFMQFSSMYFIQNTLYSIIYLVVILYFTVIIFNRKKFEG